MADNDASRRSFLKKAAIGGLALSATAAAAQKVVSVASEVDVKNAYLKDILPGDKVWQGREYVTMTESEKNQLVQRLTQNYKKERS